MRGTYYTVVDGDPLTSGSNSRAYARSGSCFIDDDEGRMVFIGDPAYCERCDSVGKIVGGAGVSDMHRMIDMENLGRRQAVGGDWVLCKCPERPRVLAYYARSWIIHDSGDAEQRAERAITPTPRLVYDEQFTLIDAEGKALPQTYYTVQIPSGELVHGITDSAGHTARHETDGAQRIAIYLGLRQHD